MLSARSAANVLLACLGALAVFHVLVLLNVLPPEIVWGGRAGGGTGFVVLEVVALLVTILFAAIAAARAGYFGCGAAGRPASVAMWFVFGYFALGVPASLASTSSLERAIFTPANVVLAVLSLRLAMSGSSDGATLGNGKGRD